MGDVNQTMVTKVLTLCIGFLGLWMVPEQLGLMSSNVEFKSREHTDKAVVTELAAPSHAPFSDLLKKHVSASGAVNYAALKKEQAQLDAYLKTLANQAPEASWSRNEKLAYWINLYNAATLDLILDHYPISSIMSLDGGKTWDVKRVKSGSRTLSLNQIENEIIRPEYKEPRIHFAVNCAAKGCPPLRNAAFIASKLDQQLEEQTRKFINNPAHIKISGKQVQISRIFDWYSDDFTDVKSFIGRYRDIPKDSNLTFTDYDWSLNKA